MCEIENDHGMYYDETITGYYGDGHDTEDPAYSLSIGCKRWTIVQPELGNGWHSIVHVSVDKFLDDTGNFVECSLLKPDNPSSLGGGPFAKKLDAEFESLHYGKWPRILKAWQLFETQEDALHHIIKCYKQAITYIENDMKKGIFDNMSGNDCILVCPPQIVK